MARVAVIMFLLLSSTSYAQRVDSILNSLAKRYGAEYDSIATVIDLASPSFSMADTTAIRDINNPSRLAGYLIANYKKFDDTSLAKVIVTDLNNVNRSFYYQNRLLIKGVIETSEGKTVYYYPPDVNMESPAVHYKIGILYPDTKLYWENLELGKSYLEELQRLK